MRKEPAFLTRLRDSFIHYDQFFYKIPDMPMNAKDSSSHMRFNIKKPFDAFAVVNLKPMAIEAKYQREYKGFGLKQMRPHQIVELESFLHHGLSYVMLNIQNAGDSSKGLKRINRLFIFEWSQFRDRKFIGKKELMEEPFIEYKKGIYPIYDWLSTI